MATVVARSGAGAFGTTRVRARRQRRARREPTAASAVLQEALPLAPYFVAGGVCCCVSHTGSVPLDVVKTRLQTDAGTDAGLVACARRIV